eukprot:43915-Pleurochrysis_carterae.AAC.3
MRASRPFLSRACKPFYPMHASWLFTRPTAFGRERPPASTRWEPHPRAVYLSSDLHPSPRAQQKHLCLVSCPSLFFCNPRSPCLPSPESRNAPISRCSRINEEDPWPGGKKPRSTQVPLPLPLLHLSIPSPNLSPGSSLPNPHPTESAAQSQKSLLKTTKAFTVDLSKTQVSRTTQQPKPRGAFTPYQPSRPHCECVPFEWQPFERL